ncbi:GntR family transcriptional regulator [Sphingopyxis chilensis]|uniref:GntR family transcriptional regulator n=1 Tax=Sphingopyxis chilensis TaxID=180400 RepID=UPI002DDD7953|nr:GntR family transcriptional regulator [Sphingopyxis chilensis]
MAEQDVGVRPSEKVERLTLGDSTTDQLRRMIISGELPDGKALRQDEIAARLGVSRSPLREALSRLEAEGLIAGIRHRGYVVTGLSHDEILELFELRAMLEPDLIARAIPRMTQEDIEKAKIELSAYDREISGAAHPAWGEGNTRFHMALYSPSGRTTALEIVRGLLTKTARYTRTVLTLGTGVDQAKEDHSNLLALCSNRSPHLAAALTRDHIERARDDLFRLLEQS